MRLSEANNLSGKSMLERISRSARTGQVAECAETRGASRRASWAFSSSIHGTSRATISSPTGVSVLRKLRLGRSRTRWDGAMSCCDGWRERAYGSRAADWRDLISVCYWSKIPYGHSRGEETQVPKMPKLAMEKLCLR